MLGQWLPMPPERAGDVRMENSYSAYLDTRLIWLDLRYGAARERLPFVDGPLVVVVKEAQEHDPNEGMLVGTENTGSFENYELYLLLYKLSRKTPVGIIYSEPLSDSQARADRGIPPSTRVQHGYVTYRHTVPIDLANLRSLIEIQMLTLHSDTIKNFSRLAEFKELRVLDLERTSVSDAQVEAIAQLQALSVLRLRQTQVTSDGLARLKKALPHCTICLDASDEACQGN